MSNKQVPSIDRAIAKMNQIQENYVGMNKSYQRVKFCHLREILEAMRAEEQESVLSPLEWFTAPNPLLGNISPIDMIKNGRGDKLCKWILNQVDENSVPESVEKDSRQTESKKDVEDLSVHGVSINKDGERIDPKDFYKPEPLCECGHTKSSHIYESGSCRTGKVVCYCTSYKPAPESKPVETSGYMTETPYIKGDFSEPIVGGHFESTKECEHISGGLGACPKCGTPYKNIEPATQSKECECGNRFYKAPESKSLPSVQMGELTAILRENFPCDHHAAQNCRCDLKWAKAAQRIRALLVRGVE